MQKTEFKNSNNLIKLWLLGYTGILAALMYLPDQEQIIMNQDPGKVTDPDSQHCYQRLFDFKYKNLRTKLQLTFWIGRLLGTMILRPGVPTGDF